MSINSQGTACAGSTHEITRHAFYDITQILNVDNQGNVTMRDPTSLPEDLRRAIVAIKPVEVGERIHYECKFADKQKALDSLARYLQMFKDTLVVDVQNFGDVVEGVARDLVEDALDRQFRRFDRRRHQFAVALLDLNISEQTCSRRPGDRGFCGAGLYLGRRDRSA